MIVILNKHQIEGVKPKHDGAQKIDMTDVLDNSIVHGAYLIAFEEEIDTYRVMKDRHSGMAGKLVSGYYLRMMIENLMNDKIQYEFKKMV